MPRLGLGITDTQRAREAAAHHEAAMRRREREQKAALLATRTASPTLGVAKPQNTYGGLMKMLKPAELQKYKLLAKAREGTMRGLEAGLNQLERESGIDLDGDGDVGLTNAAAVPRGEPALGSHRAAPRPRTSPATFAKAPGANTPLPSWRQATSVPMSRDHASPDFELHRCASAATPRTCHKPS